MKYGGLAGGREAPWTGASLEQLQGKTSPLWNVLFLHGIRQPRSGGRQGGKSSGSVARRLCAKPCRTCFSWDRVPGGRNEPADFVPLLSRRSCDLETSSKSHLTHNIFGGDPAPFPLGSQTPSQLGPVRCLYRERGDGAVVTPGLVGLRVKQGQEPGGSP